MKRKTEGNKFESLERRYKDRIEVEKHGNQVKYMSLAV